MEKLMYLGANAMAAVMDFGVGALVAVLLCLYFEAPIATHTLLIGGVLALLPDFDVVPRIFSLQFVEFDHHQTLFHRPLALLSVSGLVAYLLGGQVWLVITLACVTYHYLHDIGWTRNSYNGIALFWPFSTRCWSWFGSYEQPSHFPHKAWIDTFWLQPTIKSASELMIGLLAMTVAIFLFDPSSYFIWLILSLILSGSLFVWTVAFKRA